MCPTKRLLTGKILVFFVSLLVSVGVHADFNLRMQLDMGAINIIMYDSSAPNTVANFMDYVNQGDYDGSLFHRYAESPPGTPFVLQGGGHFFNPNLGSFFGGGAQAIPVITANLPLINEFSLSNTRGTLAMAKVGSDPDSATSQWFFNLQDNSANLDSQNGGFTVFAEVLGNGMDVVDEIAALGQIARCVNVEIFPGACGVYSEMPIIVQSPLVFLNSTIFNITSIGLDNDGDGAVDKQEDLAPNAGDGNNDNIPDNTQQYVASYRTEARDSVVIQTPPAIPLKGFNVLGSTFGLAKLSAPSNFQNILVSDNAFEHGFAGYELEGLAAGGAVTVVVTLPIGETPDIYYNYGSEPGNQVPHWYEFTFDGTTGAEYNGNVITLHFVDGLRGDSDLDKNNGIIVAAPGGAATVAGRELDGVNAAVEDAGPNAGDANGDNILDSLQSHVASFPDINGDYVMLETVLPLTPHLVGEISGTEFDPRLSGGQLGPPELSGLNFSNGFFTAVLYNLVPGGNASFTLTLPPGANPVTYYMFGPEQGNSVPHWYEFMFDPATGTGAVINGNEITLHFVDGQRGDADLDSTNGVIIDPGGPAYQAANTLATSSGGCKMTTGQGSVWQGGAWWFLLGIMFMRAGWQYRRGLQ